MDFYSYALSFDGDTYRYSFNTEKNYTYIVSFHPPDQYNPAIENFEHLLNHSKVVLLTCADELDDKKCYFKGLLIGNTVCLIINDFLNTETKNLSLIFHCDDADKKQLYRSKLFEKWEKQASDLYKIKMNILEINVPIDETNFKKTFIGIAYKDDISYKESLFKEFIEISTLFTNNAK